MTDPIKLKAQRCLFGKPDRETIERNENERQDMLKKEAEEQKEKWNFDFETGTPLQGRYQWEKVEAEKPDKEKEI